MANDEEETMDLEDLGSDVEEVGFTEGGPAAEAEADAGAKKVRAKTRRVREMLGGGVVHLHITNQLPPTAAETASMIVDGVHSQNELKMETLKAYTAGWWNAFWACIALVVTLVIVVVVVFAYATSPPPPLEMLSSSSSAPPPCMSSSSVP